jgi:hypothetical protein
MNVAYKLRRKRQREHQKKVAAVVCAVIFVPINLALLVFAWPRVWPNFVRWVVDQL